MDHLILPQMTLSPELLSTLRCSICEARYEMKCAWCQRDYCCKHIWVDSFHPRAICINCRPQNYQASSRVILVDHEYPCFVDAEDRIVAVVFNSGRRLCVVGSVQEEPEYLATDTAGRMLLYWSWVEVISNGPPHYTIRRQWPLTDVKLLMTLDNWRILKDKSPDEILMNYQHLLKDSWKYRIPKHIRPKE